jgi:hypothetical protein
MCLREVTGQSDLTLAFHVVRSFGALDRLVLPSPRVDKLAHPELRVF